MLARLPIRFKLILALALWLITVSVLCWSSFEGLYAYRGLVKHMERVAKLPRASDLERRVNQLHLEMTEWLEREHQAPGLSIGQFSSEGLLMRKQLALDLDGVRMSLADYREQSESKLAGSTQRNFELESANLREVEKLLDKLEASLERPVREDDPAPLADAEKLKDLVGDLPRAVQSDVGELPQVAGVAYEERIQAAWVTSSAAALLTGLMLWVLYRWVFRPLRVLIKGSRKVANGDFGVQINVDSRDEVGELAAAMNEMTHEFGSIRDDLDRQVQERTAQAVRTERLAGVGFLAAGVADEISAPLAVIRDRAKTLQAAFAAARASRPTSDAATTNNSVTGAALPNATTTSLNNIATVISELQAISAAAFRCKEITQSLLDLSRSGNDRRERLDLCELGQGVVDLLNRTGKYAHKRIDVDAGGPVVIEGNPQEIKQVVLALLVHRLDRVAAGEGVTLQMGSLGDLAELIVADHAEALEVSGGDAAADLGEPSTVFGLSLAKCIVQDHGGHFEVPSWSPSKSGPQERVRVTLPLATSREESSHRYQVV